MAELQIPVRLQIENLKTLVSDLEKQLSNLKVGSSGFESLKKIITSIRGEIDRLSSQTAKPFINNTQFTQAERSIQKIEDQIDRVQTSMRQVKFSDLNLNESQKADLAAFESQINSIKDALKNAKNDAKTAFLESDVGKNWVLNFDQAAATKSLSDITKEIHRKAQEQEDDLKRLQQAANDYQKALSQKTVIDNFMKKSGEDLLSQENLGDKFNQIFQQTQKGIRYTANGRSILRDWLEEQLHLDNAVINEIVNKKVSGSQVGEVLRKALENQLAMHNNTISGGDSSTQIAETKAKLGEISAASTAAQQAQTGLSNTTRVLGETLATVTGRYNDYKETLLSAVHNNQQVTSTCSAMTSQLNQFRSTLEQANAKFIQLSRTQQSFNQMKWAVVNFMGFNQVLNLTKNAVRNAISHIRELDSVMNKISIVTDMSTSDLWNQVDVYSKMAQAYGVSIKGAYEVSQIYYQQGLQTRDVMTLTNETLKLAKISGLDYATTTDYMTTALRGFKMEMSDASVVVDVYSNLAAHTAVSQQELAVAMSKTASSMEGVGATFEEASAMIGTMVAVTRESATNIGSAMKSIASRYGELTKDPTKLVDEDGEAMAFNKVDAALQSVGISMRTVDGQFRDFTEVIVELGEKWDQLDSTQQRYIATQFAGNRQQSRFLALVSNIDLLKSNMDVAMNSEDTGTLQALKALDSIESKTEQVRVAYQQFYTTIGAEGAWKGLLNGAVNVVNTLNELPKLFGKIPIAAITMIADIVSVIKGIGTAIITEFASIWRNVLANNDSVNAGTTVGEGFIQGAKAGITSGVGEIQAAWKTLRGESLDDYLNKKGLTTPRANETQLTESQKRSPMTGHPGLDYTKAESQSESFVQEQNNKQIEYQAKINTEEVEQKSEALREKAAEPIEVPVKTQADQIREEIQAKIQSAGDAVEFKIDNNKIKEELNNLQADFKAITKVPIDTSEAAEKLNDLTERAKALKSIIDEQPTGTVDKTLKGRATKLVNNTTQLQTNTNAPLVSAQADLAKLKDAIAETQKQPIEIQANTNGIKVIQDAAQELLNKLKSGEIIVSGESAKTQLQELQTEAETFVASITNMPDPQANFSTIKEKLQEIETLEQALANKDISPKQAEEAYARLLVRLKECKEVMDQTFGPQGPVTADGQKLAQQYAILESKSKDLANSNNQIAKSYKSMGSAAAGLNMLATFLNKGTRSSEIFSGSLMAVAGGLRAIDTAMTIMSSSNPWGAVLTGAMAVINIINGISTAWESTEERQERLAKEAEQLTNIAKEQKANYNTLNNSIQKLDELREKRYESAEAAEEYQTAVDDLAAKFPEMVSGFNEAGNIIINTTDSERILAAARQKSADATYEAARAELKSAKDKLSTAVENAKAEQDALASLLVPEDGGRGGVIEFLQQGRRKAQQKYLEQNVDEANYNRIITQYFTNDEYYSNEVLSDMLDSAGFGKFTFDEKYNDENIQALQSKFEDINKRLKGDSDKGPPDLASVEGAQIIADLNAALNEAQDLEVNVDVILASFSDLNKYISQYTDLLNTTNAYSSQVIQGWLKSTGKDKDYRSSNFASTMVSTALANKQSDFAQAFEQDSNYRFDLTEDENVRLLDSYAGASEAATEFFSHLNEEQIKTFDKMAADTKNYSARDFAVEFGKITGFEKFYETVLTPYYKQGIDSIQQRLIDNFKSQYNISEEVDIAQEENRKNFTGFQTAYYDAITQAVTPIEEQYLNNVLKQYSDLADKGYSQSANAYQNAALSLFTQISQLPNNLDTAIWEIILSNGLNTIEGINNSINSLGNIEGLTDTQSQALEGWLTQIKSTIIPNLNLSIQTQTQELLDTWADTSKNLTKAVEKKLTLQEANELIQQADSLGVEIDLTDFTATKDKMILSAEKFSEYWIKLQQANRDNAQEFQNTIDNAQAFLRRLQSNGIIGIDLKDQESMQRTFESIGIEWQDSYLYNGQLTTEAYNAIQQAIKDAQDGLNRFVWYNETAAKQVAQAYDWSQGNYFGTSKKSDDTAEVIYDSVVKNIDELEQAILDDATKHFSSKGESDDVKKREMLDYIYQSYDALISDVLSKGFSNIHLEDYEGLIEGIDIDLSNTNYADFVDKYVKYAGKTISEINDLYLQALEKDRSLDTTSPAILTDLQFINWSQFSATSDELKSLADTFGIDLRKYIGKTRDSLIYFDEQLNEYVVNFSLIPELSNLSSIKGFSSTVRDSIDEFFSKLTDLIQSALKGSLKYTEADQLQEFARQQGLNDLRFERTAEGLQLATNSAWELVQAVTKLDGLQGEVLFTQLMENAIATEDAYASISANTAHIKQVNYQLAGAKMVQAGVARGANNTGKIAAFEKVNGNVNLYNRPKIDNGDGTYSTLQTATLESRNFESEIPWIMNITPIPPDAKTVEDIMSDKELNNYVQSLLDKNPMSAQVLLNLDKLENGGKGLIIDLKEVNKVTEEAVNNAAQEAETLHEVSEVFEAIKAGETFDSTKIDQYEQELALAQKIMEVRSTTEDDSFNFMSQKIPSGQNNPLNYWSNWYDAFAKMKATSYKGRDRGKMAYEDFYNIVTEMGNIAEISGVAVDIGGRTVANSEQAVDLITEAAGVLSNMSTGDMGVNLGKIGINFSSGVDKMAENVDDGIEALAKEQIDMLDSMIALLETIVAMEELGDLDADNDMIISVPELLLDADGLKDGILDVEGFIEIFGSRYKAIVEKIASTFTPDDNGKTALDYVTVNGHTITEIFNASEQNLKDWNIKAADLSTLLTNLYQITSSNNFDQDRPWESFLEIFQGMEWGDLTIGANAGSHQIILSDQGVYSIKYDSEAAIKKMRAGIPNFAEKNDEEIVAAAKEAIDKSAKGKILTVEQNGILHILNGDIAIKTENGKTTYSVNGQKYDNYDAAVAAADVFSVPNVSKVEVSEGNTAKGVINIGDRSIEVISQGYKPQYWYDGESHTTLEQAYQALYEDAVGKSATQDGIKTEEYKAWEIQQGITVVPTVTVGGQETNLTYDTQVRQAIDNLYHQADDALVSQLGAPTNGVYTVELGNNIAVQLKAEDIQVNGQVNASKVREKLAESLGVDSTLASTISEGIKGAFGEAGIPLDKLKIVPEKIGIDGDSVELTEPIVTATGTAKELKLTYEEPIKLDTLTAIITLLYAQYDNAPNMDNVFLHDGNYTEAFYALLSSVGVSYEGDIDTENSSILLNEISYDENVIAALSTVSAYFNGEATDNNITLTNENIPYSEMLGLLLTGTVQLNSGANTVFEEGVITISDDTEIPISSVVNGLLTGTIKLSGDGLTAQEGSYVTLEDGTQVPVEGNIVGEVTSVFLNATKAIPSNKKLVLPNGTSISINSIIGLVTQLLLEWDGSENNKPDTSNLNVDSDIYSDEPITFHQTYKVEFEQEGQEYNDIRKALYNYSGTLAQGSRTRQEQLKELKALGLDEAPKLTDWNKYNLNGNRENTKNLYQYVNYLEGLVNNGQILSTLDLSNLQKIQNFGGALDPDQLDQVNNIISDNAILMDSLPVESLQQFSESFSTLSNSKELIQIVIDALTLLEEKITSIDTVDPQIDITVNNETALRKLQQVISKLNLIKSKSITITTNNVEKTPSSPTSSNQNGKLDESKNHYITGAGAKGNAALAQGTLMGELGPELYVTGGRYYIAGQNGAEFVDLPDDAIVFNHLQTRRLMSTGFSSRGTPTTSEKNATSFATGNWNGGEAMASASAALTALKQLRAMWVSLAGMNAKDLAGAGGSGGGGGGSSDDQKAFLKDLEKWYNWLQEIDKLEQHITYQETLRSKIQSDMVAHGQDYFKSELISLDNLDKEVAIQKDLYESQAAYFEKRMAQLNSDFNPFSSLYSFDEKGQLKYKEGKLEQLSYMSGTDQYGKPNMTAEEQYNYIVNTLGIDSTYLQYDDSGNEIKKTDDDGKENENYYTEVVEAFWNKIDADKEEAQTLYDSVQEHKEAMVEKQGEINELLQDMEDNTIDLEGKVYDAIVDMREREIKEFEDTRDQMKENNEALIDGLNKQLEAEKQAYETQKSNDELTSLQRRLAILQRSGGSASEIASLEKEITTKQQDMYWESQQAEIDALQEASETELEKLDAQIDLMTETLAYQKENGLLNAEVYQQMLKSPEEIANFIQTNNSEYWQKTPTDLEKTLREDLFSAQSYRAMMDEYGSINKLIEYYSKTVLGQEGNDEEAQQISDKINGKQETEETGTPNGSIESKTGTWKQNDTGWWYEYDDGSYEQNSWKTINGKKYRFDENGYMKTGWYQEGDKWYYLGDYGAVTGAQVIGGKIWNFDENGVWDGKDGVAEAVEGDTSDTSVNEDDKKKNRGWHVAGLSGVYSSKALAESARDTKIEELSSVNSTEAMKQIQSLKNANIKYYSEGGLDDYTGLAALHGTKSKPEAVLNASQTHILRDEILSNKPDSLLSLLSDWRAAQLEMQKLYDINNNTSSISIEKAEVIMQVQHMNNDYDAQRAGDQALEQIMKIARKSIAQNRIGR